MRKSIHTRSTGKKAPGNKAPGKKPPAAKASRSIAPARPKPLRACIIDNESAIRDSLSFLIESDQIPVETFASAREFLENWDIARTGCLIVDIRMPGMDGLDLQAELTRRGITIPLIFITGYGEVQLAVQAMKRGAFDFFEKPINHPLLLDRLNIALAKESSARREAAQKLEYQRRLEQLSPKERRILDLVSQGKTSGEISLELDCACKTVEVHRASIYGKMECKNLAVLVRMVTSGRVDESDNQ